MSTNLENYFNALYENTCRSAAAPVANANNPMAAAANEDMQNVNLSSPPPGFVSSSAMKKAEFY